jgi:hypothetical protein
MNLNRLARILERTSPGNIPDFDTLPPLPDDLRELMLDRLEAAWADGTLPPDLDVYSAVLCALVPEDFRIEQPVKPDQSPPGSTARIDTYRRRAAGGAIFLTSDRQAIVADAREGMADREAVAARDRGNNFGAIPLGWTSPKEAPSIEAGMYRSLTGEWFEVDDIAMA